MVTSAPTHLHNGDILYIYTFQYRRFEVIFGRRKWKIGECLQTQCRITHISRIRFNLDGGPLWTDCRLHIQIEFIRDTDNVDNDRPHFALCMHAPMFAQIQFEYSIWYVFVSASKFNDRYHLCIVFHAPSRTLHWPWSLNIFNWFEEEKNSFAYQMTGEMFNWIYIIIYHWRLADIFRNCVRLKCQPHACPPPNRFIDWHYCHLMAWPVMSKYLLCKRHEYCIAIVWQWR